MQAQGQARHYLQAGLLKKNQTLAASGDGGGGGGGEAVQAQRQAQHAAQRWRARIERQRAASQAICGPRISSSCWSPAPLVLW